MSFLPYSSFSLVVARLIHVDLNSNVDRFELEEDTINGFPANNDDLMKRLNDIESKILNCGEDGDAKDAYNKLLESMSSMNEESFSTLENLGFSLARLGRRNIANDNVESDDDVLSDGLFENLKDSSSEGNENDNDNVEEGIKNLADDNVKAAVLVDVPVESGSSTSADESSVDQFRHTGSKTTVLVIDYYNSLINIYINWKFWHKVGLIKGGILPLVLNISSCF